MSQFVIKALGYSFPLYRHFIYTQHHTLPFKSRYFLQLSPLSRLNKRNKMLKSITCTYQRQVCKSSWRNISPVVYVIASVKKKNLTLKEVICGTWNPLQQTRKVKAKKERKKLGQLQGEEFASWSMQMVGPLPNSNGGKKADRSARRRHETLELQERDVRSCFLIFFFNYFYFPQTEHQIGRSKQRQKRLDQRRNSV